MTTQVTFYLSRVIGTHVVTINGLNLGIIKDLVLDTFNSQSEEPIHSMVVAIKVRKGKEEKYLDIRSIQIEKKKVGYVCTCHDIIEIQPCEVETKLMLAENVLDRQIVDINGRKLVRVNDIRLVYIGNSVRAVAVDVGLEGLLRRIGISKPIKYILNLLHLSLPAEFILWDDVATVDIGNSGIRLSKTNSKLKRLHPSDLADIIEELGHASKTAVFATLDEEHAADVLEELEEEEQIQIIEALSVERAADVLEKMPADEAADILEELEVDRAEKLLLEMEPGSSEEVRELLEYKGYEVGSIMTTDYLSFHQSMTVENVLTLLRLQKPEAHFIYSMLVTDETDHFISTISLRDLVVSEPQLQLKEIMDKNPLFIYDTDKLDSLAEIIEKYSLLALPVLDSENKLQGLVIVEDIIEDLLDKRKTE